MSILLKNITLKNFLSIGAVTQAVDFNRTDLTLILGENLDLGGDGARNGTGKTSLIQGLSYALFGVPINNIRKDNLVNRTNGKGMLVTLVYSVGGVEYKIERGRKPNLLRFYVNSALQGDKDDAAQGENKETQQAIEKTLNMTADMFRHIVALNTYSEPFLALKTNEQRTIIEQLLGITILSEKAETLKVMLSASKDSIKSEEFRVKADEEANKRIVEQIDALKRRQMLWTNKHDADLVAYADQYDELSRVDIDAELQAHKDLAVYTTNKKNNDALINLITRQSSWEQKRSKEVDDLRVTYDKKNSIDIVAELQKHSEVASYNQRVKDKAAHDNELKRATTDIVRHTKEIVKLEADLISLHDHKCHACGQEFHDEQHTVVLSDKEEALRIAKHALVLSQESTASLEANHIVLGKMQATIYKTEAEAFKHSSELEGLLHKITDKENESDPYAEQLAEAASAAPLGKQPVTIYESEADAIRHSSTVTNLLSLIQAKHDEIDPYSEQIAEMEKTAIQVINFDTINALTKTAEHQKFLLDLLTSKDSFIRKKIIDQSLVFLNSRLQMYLEKLGLPHSVVFQNDLTVQIEELGRELDYGNLSRGEANRLILGLSLAFKDVWENLYQPINLLFIDELLDSGMDTIGTENSIAILKDLARNRHKSVWLISHKDELVSRVSNVLKVVKEAGFTEYQPTTIT